VQAHAQRNAQIFDEMMAVDVNIARGLDGEIEAPVFAPLFQHVLPERRTGFARQLDVERARAIQIQRLARSAFHSVLRVMLAVRVLISISGRCFR
jgi:hypothetical protein